MLRAVIQHDGQQRVLAAVPPYHIEVLDLRGRDPQETQASLDHVREELSHQVLPTDRWPLFEIRATRLDEDRTRVHLSFDILICDAWSFGVLLRELRQLYQDPSNTLPPQEISFRDYVMAEAALLSSPVAQRSREYWQKRLPVLPPSPDLPLAVAPSAVMQPRFTRRARRLSLEQWRSFKHHAAKFGLTPSAAMMTAFCELLAAWSRSPQLSINVTLFNRHPLHRDVNGLVGDFTSLAMIAADATAPCSFMERARHVQRQLWEALDHPYVSGVQLVRGLGQLQGKTCGGVMPVVFTSTLMHESSHANQTSSGNSTSWLGQTVYKLTQTPQVWLDHHVEEIDGTLDFNWDTVDGLFPEGLLDQMFATYSRFILELAGDEGCWHREVSPLISSEWRRHIETLNATETHLPVKLMHELFFETAHEQPLATAVVASERQLTYGELSGIAAHLGLTLRLLGARPNQAIGVVLKKGWEQVAAVLGIQASGAAYLPLEPTLPRERLHYFLEQAEVEVVLTDALLDVSLDWPPSVRRVVISDSASDVADNIPLAPVQVLDDLAYIIFTSGSTGQPKGVMISHRAAVNTLLDINQRFGVGPADRILALSSLSFDLSVYDIFGVLAAGGTVVLPSAAATRDPSAWLKLIGRERITIWNTVPALMKMLVEYARGASVRLPDSLRLVLMSGDWIPTELPTQIQEFAKAPAVISLGGATEAAIWSNFFPVDHVDPAWKSIPYGKPLANQQIYVLNPVLEICPVWVTGDLYIGGLGVATGYWKDADKTQASFILHPKTRERLYRTGDLGRYLPDGNIEFLGREDSQVKVNGHRIELVEIEETLRKHPAISAAVVSALGEPRADKRLVAYVVLKKDNTPPVERLEESANQELSAVAMEMGRSLPPLTRPAGFLTDPIERMTFKMQQQGIRRDVDGLSIGLDSRLSLDELKQSFAIRRTHRKFLQETISFAQFSEFISSLRQVELSGMPKYRYPSGGGLYPTQVYLDVKPDRVEGVFGGTYYYHPLEHRLYLLSEDEHIGPNAYKAPNRPIVEESAFALIIVGNLDAIEPMYGPGGRDLCMLEAGYIGQLLMTVAPECDLGVCAIGTLDPSRCFELFKLTARHIVLHSFLIGAVGTPVPLREVPAKAPAPVPAARLEPVTPHQLVEFLKQKLPDYMVPSVILPCEALPLTANGKVGRKALPLPKNMRVESEAEFVPPGSDVERIIAGIWRDVLQVESLGIHDRFFDLGGNSLLMVQVHARLGKIFDKTVSIIDMFFKYPTINSLAAFLSEGDSPDGGSRPSPSAGRRSEERREALQRQRRIRQRRQEPGKESEE